MDMSHMRLCCICMFIYMYVCVYVHICICMYMYVRVCVYTYVHMYVYMYACMYVCMHIKSGSMSTLLYNDMKRPGHNFVR